MGRRKSVPQKRPLRIEPNDDDSLLPTNELLGRHSFLVGNTQKNLSLEQVHWMMTEEVVVPDRRQVMQELEELVDSSSEEEDQVQRKRPRKRKRLQQKRKKNKKKIKSKSNSSSLDRQQKRVQFAEENLVHRIPDPELQVLQENGNQRVVLYSPRIQSIDPPVAGFTLGKWPLPLTTRVLVRGAAAAVTDQETLAASAASLSISSETGVLVLLSRVLDPAEHESSLLLANNTLLARAVGMHQTIAVELVQGSNKENTSKNDNNDTESECWCVRVGITAKAFQLCWAIPPTVTLRQRQQSKKWRPVHELHRILANLYPDGVLASIMSSRNTNALDPDYCNRACTTITAKRVYALTDNVQLQAATNIQQNGTEETTTPLHIPGLNPELRPYQEAAVRWMLKRETANSDNNADHWLPNDEWKLAWEIINPDGSVEPLYKGTYRMDDDSPRILCCPFTGWLAQSIVQARDMTVSSLASREARGGILAESMGLGKTVELLACILSHPRPMQMTPVSKAKRKLTFPKVGSTSHVVEKCPPSVEEESDKVSFGEVDHDSDTESIVRGEYPGLELTDTAKQFARVPVVTPEKPSRCSVEERWMEEDTIGSCICSKLISFSTIQKKDRIMLCESCNDPMHSECTAFDSEAEMFRTTRPCRIRQHFSNKTFDCRICSSTFCPCCVARDRKQLITTSATLIVTPAAILNQWIREINRHCKPKPNGEPLLVVVYDGIRRLCNPVGQKSRDNMKYLHPRHLASADIVLMTFDALMNDLGHSDDNKFTGDIASVSGPGSLRTRKKYRVVPSPLQAIHWWRICLDEAQRVETPTAGSAKMALKLAAEYRWCVSGTPVGRGKLEDLYGLLLFLRVQPFCSKVWFTKCFNSSHRGVDDRIGYLLKDVFWRSTKALQSVREQMGVPEQVEKRVVLKFSSIEKHFYDRQLEETLVAADDAADREKSGKRIANYQANILAERLHRLRAACCHPQVGSNGVGQNVRKNRRQRDCRSENTSLGSRVMSMGQILDKFIDDAKQKCEEAQRLAIMHTNAMAAISRLMVSAKDRGITIDKTDAELLHRSCKLYEESLQLGEENSVPCRAMGEVEVTGSVGFQNPQGTVRTGECTLGWKLQTNSQPPSARIDFVGPTRKITKLRLQTVVEVPEHLPAAASEKFVWKLYSPKDVVFQVSNSAIGGEFIDVASLLLPHPCSNEKGSWTEQSGFLTNKSKSWRLIIKTFHDTDGLNGMHESDLQVGGYAGLHVEWYEAEISYDPLQRLHCLHNAALSYESLVNLPRDASIGSQGEVVNIVAKMRREETKIEGLYMEVPHALHRECHRRLKAEYHTREVLQMKLCAMCPSKTKHKQDGWDDNWWDEFLVLASLCGTETQKAAICDRVLQDADGFLHTDYESISTRDGIIAFPSFGDINGLRVALQLRIEGIRQGLGGKSSKRTREAVSAGSASSYEMESRGARIRFQCSPGGHKKCMDSIISLSEYPGEAEKIENRHCRVCKADWFQTGPKCQHCKIGEDLEDLNADRVTLLIMKSVFSLLKGSLGNSMLKKSRDAKSMRERAGLFMELLQAEKRERTAAWRLWRAHLDLLNDLDELNQCKSSMRLTLEGENVTEFSEDQLNSIVVPLDVGTRYYGHASKQAMALGNLRRAKDTLRYLKNQCKERAKGNDEERKACEPNDQCVVCLSDLDSERSVLRCGHSFHHNCLAKLQARSSIITCPMRCKLQTASEDVLIATSRRCDDGSRSKRSVKGSWGTKVTRLVNDVLEIRDQGEKGVIFSQWDDMLDIVQLALAENGVNVVRATGLRKIGKNTDIFLRQKDCCILLLNVKSGAEGLTLLEATHIFMVEPLLNCGLDSQAINRIHRIGQNKRTYVHRYLIQDTIEVKIDEIRARHMLEDDLENSILEVKQSSAYGAGGIDGGFKSQEELMSILKP